MGVRSAVVMVGIDPMTTGTYGLSITASALAGSYFAKNAKAGEMPDACLVD